MTTKNWFCGVLVAMALAGCGDSTTPTDGSTTGTDGAVSDGAAAETDAPTVILNPNANVDCGDSTCSGATSQCCVMLALPPVYTCVAAGSSCGEMVSSIQCDDRSDCGDGVCCGRTEQNQAIGESWLISECRASSCGQQEDEVCREADGCSDPSWTCCVMLNRENGVCRPSPSQCPAQE